MILCAPGHNGQRIVFYFFSAFYHGCSQTLLKSDNEVSGVSASITCVLFKKNISVLCDIHRRSMLTLCKVKYVSWIPHICWVTGPSKEDVGTDEE